MSILRKAAHERHALVPLLCWWWNPPMYVVSRAIHREFVDSFYDALEGNNSIPPFLLDEKEEHRK